MKKLTFTVVLLLIVSAAMLFASGSSETSSETADNNELRLYIWTEYMDPEIITDFEEEFGCTVVEDYYESNEEMLAKLQAGGSSQYDIIVPSDYIMVSLIALDLLQPIDKTIVTNMGNLSENFVDPPYDKGNVYSAAYQWGTVGLVFNKEKVGDAADSWSVIFENPKGLPYLLFDSEREQTGIALAYLGYSMNTLDRDELKEAADLLIAAKKNKACQGFEANVGGRNKVIAGAVDIALAYNGDVIQSINEHPEIGFSNPGEGTVVWVDSMCIPSEAPNPSLANKFMNYILDAEVGARLSNYNQYATPNGAALPYINEEDKVNPAIYPDAETEKRLQYIEDLGNDNTIYSELWKMVKAR